MWCTLLVDRIGTPREDNGSDIMRCKFRMRHEAGIEFTIDVEFTNATSDEVGVLRSKV
jgi:hypothetical protein